MSSLWEFLSRYRIPLGGIVLVWLFADGVFGGEGEKVLPLPTSAREALVRAGAASLAVRMLDRDRTQDDWADLCDSEVVVGAYGAASLRNGGAESFSKAKEACEKGLAAADGAPSVRLRLAHCRALRSLGETEMGSGGLETAVAACRRAVTQARDDSSAYLSDALFEAGVAMRALAARKTEKNPKVELLTESQELLEESQDVALDSGRPRRAIRALAGKCRSEVALAEADSQAPDVLRAIVQRCDPVAAFERMAVYEFAERRQIMERVVSDVVLTAGGKKQEFNAPTVRPEELDLVAAYSVAGLAEMLKRGRGKIDGSPTLCLLPAEMVEGPCRNDSEREIEKENLEGDELYLRIEIWVVGAGERVRNVARYYRLTDLPREWLRLMLEVKKARDAVKEWSTGWFKEPGRSTSSFHDDFRSRSGKPESLYHKGVLWEYEVGNAAGFVLDHVCGGQIGGENCHGKDYFPRDSDPFLYDQFFGTAQPGDSTWLGKQIYPEERGPMAAYF